MRKRRISESESEECRIQRVKNENESEEEEEKNTERGKKGKKGNKGKKGKKGKGEALRRLINGPWRRGEANKHTCLHCAIAIVCH